MIPVDSIFRLLGAGLELWTEKEKNKYVDAYIELKQELYEEQNKPRPDHAVIDNIMFKLKLLIESFASKIGK
jgi:hypothetical protein